MPPTAYAEGGIAVSLSTSQRKLLLCRFLGFHWTVQSIRFSPPDNEQRSVFPTRQRTAKRFPRQSADSEAFSPPIRSKRSEAAHPLRAQRAQPSAERAQRCDKPFLPVGCLCYKPHHEPGTPPPLRKERSKRQTALQFPTAPKAGAGCNPAARESRGCRRGHPLGRGGGASAP